MKDSAKEQQFFQVYKSNLRNIHHEREQRWFDGQNLDEIVKKKSPRDQVTRAFLLTYFLRE